MLNTERNLRQQPKQSPTCDGMSGQDHFAQILKAAASRLGMTPAEYQARAIQGLLVREHPTALNLRSASARTIADAISETPEALTARAIKRAIEADAEHFGTIQTRPGVQIPRPGPNPASAKTPQHRKT